LNFLSSIFRKKRDSFNKEGLIVSHAFTIAGREYMEVDSIYNLPYQRGMAAVKVYEEMKMKCDYDYLKAHCQAIQNIFTNSAKLGFNEWAQIKKLNDQLLERLDIAIDTDLVYKLAAVVYFDKTESPIEFDAEYAKKKIAFWKKHKSTEAFFLQQPLQKLIPFLRSPEINFETYSQAMETLNKIHWEEVLLLLSPQQKEHYSDKNGISAEETLRSSANFTG
jgi:hypothetical protein